MFAGIPSAREAVLDRFSTFDDLEKDKSYMTRRVMNQKSLKLFEESPIFGVGPGRYREVYVPLDMPAVLAGHSEDSFMRRSSYNSYLSYLAEGGVIGTLPMAVLLVILAVRGAWSAVVLNRRGEHWALGIYASFIAMSVHFWTLSGLTGTHAWFVYGLLAATVVLAACVREKRSVSMARQQVRNPRLPFGNGRPVVVGSP
jgi:O-antigen ligase